MSNFGKKLLTTAGMYIPQVVGEAYGGGYYAGMMRFDGYVWLVVVAPKSYANTSVQFATTSATRPSTLSIYDGNKNQQILQDDGISKYPAAQYCANLSIDGFTDWHIPAELELDIAYRAFRPPNAPNTSIGANDYAEPPKGNYTATDPAYTSVPMFQTGGQEVFEPNLYLTSTIGSGNNTINLFNFNGGSRVGASTNSNRLLRPTRLVRTNLP